jgi:hypothetical protein
VLIGEKVLAMPLFAVSLLLECRVSGILPPDPTRELAIHVVEARDAAEARARGAELGTRRQHSYSNVDGDEVSWVFRHVVECQDLPDLKLTDGMEVSSWLYSGERLCLNDGWTISV